MQKKVPRKIRKCALMSFFGLFTLVFLYGELFVLSSTRLRGSVLGVESISEKKILISSEGDKKDSQVKQGITTDDARPIIIKKYLEKYNSPLVPYSKLIFDLSQTYGFEYYWIVAIAQQESNLCKKIPDGSFNCWGYGIHKKGTLKFENYELALKSYAEYLKREYFDKGLNTPELIMKKYCPSSDGSWAFGVKHFINEMETGNF